MRLFPRRSVNHLTAAPPCSFFLRFFFFFPLFCPSPLFFLKPRLQSVDKLPPPWRYSSLSLREHITGHSGCSFVSPPPVSPLFFFPTLFFFLNGHALRGPETHRPNHSSVAHLSFSSFPALASPFFASIFFLCSVPLVQAR